MRSVSMLSNNSCVASILTRFGRTFDMLYSKRAFIHWFVGDGMESGEASESRENLAALEKDYEEIEIATYEASEEDSFY